MIYMPFGNSKCRKQGNLSKVRTKGWSGYYALIDPFFVNRYTRDTDIVNGLYHVYTGNFVPKKLVINKKLRKADKKWIKKLAKKWKIKVVEKK